jgi:hypothetical protein
VDGVDGRHERGQLQRDREEGFNFECRNFKKTGNFEAKGTLKKRELRSKRNFEKLNNSKFKKGW